MAEQTNPQDILTAEDLLARMREGVKSVHEIRLRGLTVPVRPLAIDEVQMIRREAIRQAAINKGDDTDKNVEIQKATLRLASTVSKGAGPYLSDRVLSLMTTDEIGHLFDEYIVVLERYNPSLDSMTPDQFKALVDALKKNTLSAKDCSLAQLRAICTAYVDLITRMEQAT